MPPAGSHTKISDGVNDNKRLNRAMPYPRRLIFLTYAGAELLDLAGPSAVFAMANRVSGETHYTLVVASPDGGSIVHSCGLALSSIPISELDFGPYDTSLVIGADTLPLRAAMANEKLINGLVAASDRCERIGSVCSGVFLLAAAGLLSARSVATHWSAVSQLGRSFPDVRCDADALYVADGKFWTSAGVTTGIDMALAMLERDHGAELKSAVARQLVVYSHRPGHQSQFSELLAAQAKEDERFAGLTAWLNASVAIPVSVEQMASHVGMSPRSFHRHFVESFGKTPAKFHEAIRLDAARNYLEACMAISEVASKVGFQSESSFRAAFKAHFGITPKLYQETWKAH